MESLRRVLAGDRDAYGDVVREHQEMLLAYAAFRLPDPALVDEVVQQTFIRAYEQLKDCRPEKDFGVWLRTICRFMILAELKRAVRDRANRQGYQQAVRQQLLTAAIEEDLGPDTDALLHLRRCMEGLEKHALALVADRYEKRLKVEEIASRVGQSASWVATTLFRIRETLRSCIEQAALE